MSQRLLITKDKTENDSYEVILNGEQSFEEAKDILIKKYFSLGDDGLFFGPYKIRIDDIETYSKYETTIANVFGIFGKSYPDDVWVFYIDDRKIEYPTLEQLREFIKLKKSVQTKKIDGEKPDYILDCGGKPN